MKTPFSVRRDCPLVLICVALVFASLTGCIDLKAKRYAEAEAQRRKEDPAFWAELDREAALRKTQEKEVVYASIDCVSHGAHVSEYYAQDVAHGQLFIGEHGGSLSCGGISPASYPIPKVWVPGLTVRVRWSTFANGKFYWHEKYTTIARYAEAGNVYVHFFPNDEVRIVVSNIGASGDAHPIAFRSTIPPPEHLSHVDVPIVGVNVDCVVHGVVPVLFNTDIVLDNPNFSNPEGDLATGNHRRLRAVSDDGALNQEYITGCRNPTGLQIDRTWQPHKKVKVFWRREPTPQEKASQSRDQNIRITRLVSVPRYDHPMPAWLHLFPNDQARLVFSDEPPDSPKHPIARDALVPPPEVD
jgi:hypothetical protein